jgi:hypothetical protein
MRPSSSRMTSGYMARSSRLRYPYVVTLHHQCSSMPWRPLALSGRLKRHRSAPTRPTMRRRRTPPNYCSCDLSRTRGRTAPRSFSRQTWGSSDGSAHPVLPSLWARHAHAVETTATGSPSPPSRTSRIRATKSRVTPRRVPRLSGEEPDLSGCHLRGKQIARVLANEDANSGVPTAHADHASVAALYDL